MLLCINLILVKLILFDMFVNDVYADLPRHKAEIIILVVTGRMRGAPEALEGGSSLGSSVSLLRDVFHIHIVLVEGLGRTLRAIAGTFQDPRCVDKALICPL